MRIGFLVNQLATERAVYTTTLLARTAVQRGHEVVYLTIDDLALLPDGTVRGWGRCVFDPGPDAAGYLAAVAAADPQPMCVDDLDVLMNRHEPSAEVETRPWAQPIGWQFAELAQRRGVVVVNDPRGLAGAGPDKFYTLAFPARHRPPTLVTRKLDDVRAFAAGYEHDHGVVIKPLHGGAGESVFWARPGEVNLAQIVAAVARRGYVVVQPYLPAITAGSIRLFLLDGKPLTVDGQIAATRHLASGTDIRTNFDVSGTIAPAELGEQELAAAAAIGPMLAADGLFFVGLDLVGDQILEANLHSPGGLRGAQLLTGADFAGAVIDAMVARRSGTDPGSARTAVPAAAATARV